MPRPGWHLALEHADCEQDTALLWCINSQTAVDRAAGGGSLARELLRFLVTVTAGCAAVLGFLVALLVLALLAVGGVSSSAFSPSPSSSVSSSSSVSLSSSSSSYDASSSSASACDCSARGPLEGPVKPLPRCQRTLQGAGGACHGPLLAPACHNQGECQLGALPSQHALGRHARALDTQGSYDKLPTQPVLEQQGVG